MLDCQFFVSMLGKGLIIMMNQLKSTYNSPFKQSQSHPIQTCFPIIAIYDVVTGPHGALDILWTRMTVKTVFHL